MMGEVFDTSWERMRRARVVFLARQHELARGKRRSKSAVYRDFKEARDEYWLGLAVLYYSMCHTAAACARVSGSRERSTLLQVLARERMHSEASPFSIAIFVMVSMWAEDARWRRVAEFSPALTNHTPLRR